MAIMSERRGLWSNGDLLSASNVRNATLVGTMRFCLPARARCGDDLGRWVILRSNWMSFSSSDKVDGMEGISGTLWGVRVEIRGV